MSSSGTPHTPVKIYLLVFLALAILTGLTVVLSYLGLPTQTAVALAGLIALLKCSLIGFFFMHLRFEPKVIYALMFTAVFFVGVLLFFILPDIAS